MCRSKGEGGRRCSCRPTAGSRWSAEGRAVTRAEQVVEQAQAEQAAAADWWDSVQPAERQDPAVRRAWAERVIGAWAAVRRALRRLHQRRVARINAEHDVQSARATDAATRAAVEREREQALTAEAALTAAEAEAADAERELALARDAAGREEDRAVLAGLIAQAEAWDDEEAEDAAALAQHQAELEHARALAEVEAAREDLAALEDRQAAGEEDEEDAALALAAAERALAAAEPIRTEAVWPTAVEMGDDGEIREIGAHIVTEEDETPFEEAQAARDAAAKRARDARADAAGLEAQVDAARARAERAEVRAEDSAGPAADERIARVAAQERARLRAEQRDRLDYLAERVGSDAGSPREQLIAAKADASGARERLRAARDAHAEALRDATEHAAAELASAGETARRAEARLAQERRERRPSRRVARAESALAEADSAVERRKAELAADKEAEKKAKSRRKQSPWLGGGQRRADRARDRRVQSERLLGEAQKARSKAKSRLARAEDKLADVQDARVAVRPESDVESQERWAQARQMARCSDTVVTAQRAEHLAETAERQAGARVEGLTRILDLHGAQRRAARAQTQLAAARQALPAAA